MTNVFQSNVFQNNVFQQTQTAPTVGFLLRYPFYYGGGLIRTVTPVISTIEHSEHPVNCVIIETGPASELKKMQTDWFGPGGPSVETSSGIRRGNWFFKAPKSWLK